MPILVTLDVGGTGANNAADARTNLGAAPVAAYAQANAAFNQANAAYGQANSAVSATGSAANTVRVSVEGLSSQTGQLNFVNTSTIAVTVTAGANGNANIALSTTSNVSTGFAKSFLMF
jgi:hypothetical protein